MFFTSLSGSVLTVSFVGFNLPTLTLEPFLPLLFFATIVVPLFDSELKTDTVIALNCQSPAWQTCHAAARSRGPIWRLLAAHILVAVHPVRIGLQPG
jgi:hypothetical protein